MPEQPIIPFTNAAQFRKWLAKHHAKHPGIWMQIAKKDSGITSITYAEALDEALCHSWIDGQRKGHDAMWFLQKFTRRRPRSVWSRINIAHTKRLTREGRMTPAGEAAVAAAKTYGRWAAAYEGARTAEMPRDFLAALAKNKRAKAGFDSLSKTKRFAIYFQLTTAKKPDTRARRLARFIAMLSAHGPEPFRGSSANSPGEPLVDLRQELEILSDPTKASGAKRFFKTGPGEYGEGDSFLGVTVPEIRELVMKSDSLSDADLLSFLHSSWHEQRLLALLILVRRFGRKKRDNPGRKHIVDLYLANTRWVNNWDLVDASAPQILGEWLQDHDRSILRRLAASQSLWEQRIAVVATLALIRGGDFSDTLRLCESLLTHPHDLMHKACGWMLREVGKRKICELQCFLNAHAPQMPRTMLRYAIEKLSDQERRRYLSMARHPHLPVQPSTEPGKL